MFLPKKRKRRAKGISRHTRSGSAKSRSTASISSVPRAPTSLPSLEDLAQAPNKAERNESTVKLIKSLRNKQDYQARKVVRAERARDAVELELKASQGHNSTLLHSIAQERATNMELQSSVTKLSCKLSERSNRWIVCRDRLQSEMTRKINSLKQSAERKLNVLRLSHQAELSSIQAQHAKELKLERSAKYNLERQHVKQMVKLQDALEKTQKTHE